DLARTSAPRKPGAETRAEDRASAERMAAETHMGDTRAERSAAEARSEAREARSEVRSEADARADGRAHPDARSEKLDALFTPDAAKDFRSQWTNIQSRFVDDPRQAVREGDELVAQVMKSLAESFATERNRVETQLHDGTDGSTEVLRVALRRYR